MRVIRLKLTDKCHVSPCVFCPEGDAQGKGSTWDLRDGVIAASIQLADVLACAGATDEQHEVRITGGEIFGHEGSYKDFLPLIEVLEGRVKSGEVCKITLCTSLKYALKGSTLKSLVEHLQRCCPALNNKIVAFHTAWDKMYRFYGLDRENWAHNVRYLRSLGYKVSVDVIVTQAFIAACARKDAQIYSLRKKFPGELINFIPPYFHVPGCSAALRFLPKIRDYKNFLRTLKHEEPDIFTRYIALFNQDPESLSPSPESYTKKQLCGHREGYRGFADSWCCLECVSIEIANETRRPNG